MKRQTFIAVIAAAACVASCALTTDTSYEAEADVDAEIDAADAAADAISDTAGDAADTDGADTLADADADARADTDDTDASDVVDTADADIADTSDTASDAHDAPDASDADADASDSDVPDTPVSDGLTGSACSDEAPCVEGTCTAGRCAPEGMAWIPAGSFTMGSPGTELARDLDEGPQHEVTISRPFLAMQTELTQGTWLNATGVNPSFWDECGADCPVTNVSWHAAAAYANWRSIREGLTPCYSFEPGTCATSLADWASGQVACLDADLLTLECDGYRLPTEAEWEYMTRAGSTTAFPNGPLGTVTYCLEPNPFLAAIARYCANTDDGLQPGRTRDPNAWGLYDTLGNANEWVYDGYADYSSDAAVDPIVEPDVASPDDELRVLRGGRHTTDETDNRSAARLSASPFIRGNDVGFRLVRTWSE